MLCELLPPEAVLQPDPSGRTAVHLAAQGGHEECLRLVVAHGGPNAVAARRAGGETAAHDAAFHGHALCVRRLYDAEPRCIGWQDDDGDTPFHAAAARGHPAVLEELLEVRLASADSNP